MKFQKYLEIFEKELEKELNELSYPEVIVEGMKYSVLSGGKRLRPLLLLATLDSLSKKNRKSNYDLLEKGIKSAIALELIHSYSLVHDDLPALDNDEYRRGKITTHKKFGEAEAILIGDALLTHAFYILSEKNLSFLNSEKIVKIISKTSSYIGVNGMIGGQMIDIDSEQKKISLKTLEYIHKNKTGKLIKLPIEIACIIAEADEEKTKILNRYIDLIGLAFQIKDDILDVEGDFKNLGKTVGSDLKLNKSTYPSLLGMEKSKEILKNSILEAKDIIKNNFGEEKREFFIAFANYIENREK